MRSKIDPTAIDRATMSLCDQIRAVPPHADFIRTIDSSDPLPAPDRIPRIIVVPGAFHAEYPQTGGDGKRVFDLSAQLGWPCERVNLPSLASMQTNAAILLEHLARHRNSEEPILLVSLSKGGADVRTALAQPGASDAFKNVRCWISLSGIVTGTPLAEWLRSQRLRSLFVRCLLWTRGQRIADLYELNRSPDSPLQCSFSLPHAMQAIHIAGFPRVADLSNAWARRGHARLARHGPNDAGGILLHDLLTLPGLVYPVRGADHYLDPSWDIRPLLLRILRFAAAGSVATPNDR